MRDGFISSIVLIPGRSIVIAKALEKPIALVTWADDQNDIGKKLSELAELSDHVQMYCFIGNNSESIHDKFDDIIVDNGDIGKLTTFNGGSQSDAIQEAIDMSLSYDATILFVAIAGAAEREFDMLSGISRTLAVLS